MPDRNDKFLRADFYSPEDSYKAYGPLTRASVISAFNGGWTESDWQGDPEVDDYVIAFDYSLGSQLVVVLFIKKEGA